MTQKLQCRGNAKTTCSLHYLKDSKKKRRRRGRRNESQPHDAGEVKQWTRPWCWMHFIKVSGESKHRVGKIHKGKASYGGRLLKHGWSGRRGGLLCLNHVVDRVWKEPSAEGANVINMPFSVARMNVYEVLSGRWKTGKSGGVTLETSLRAVLRELALKLLRI